MVNKMTLTADEIDQVLSAPEEWMYSDEELEQWCENWRSGLE